MSDRSTKSSPRSRNAKAGSRGANTRSADVTRRVDPKVQLGELEFSDWYESQVFEPSAEERMETRATDGRAPTRLMARMAIAAGARRERLRAAREERTPAGPKPTVERTQKIDRAQKVEETAQLDAPTPADGQRPGSRPQSQPPASKQPTAKPAPQPHLPAAQQPAAVKPPPAVKPPAPARQTKPTAATPPSPAAAAPDPTPTVDRVPAKPLPIPGLAERVSWRQRAAALIDRWADKEVAIAARLDEALAPAIPWANHERKPEGSRDDATV